MRIIAGFLLIFIPTLAAASGGDDYFDSTQIRILVHSQELLLDDQFRAADSTLLDYCVRFPEEPAGLLFRASSLLAQMADREENLYESAFDSLIDRAQKLAKARSGLGSPRQQAWMHLLSGHASAYRSIYDARFGSFTSAIKNGFDAKGEYQQALNADSTLLDIYAGLGSFHYWKSAKAGFLRWLGIFHNDKARGITELKRAADQALLSGEAARNSLIWVYFDSRKFDSAETLVRRAMARYPDGKSFLWPLAQSFWEREQYQKAVEIYEEIRARIMGAPGNYYNFIECDYYIALCHDKLDEEAKAVEAARNLQNYYDDIPKQTRKRQQSKLGYLKRLAADDE